jgi:hypothetical protein
VQLRSYINHWISAKPSLNDWKFTGLIGRCGDELKKNRNKVFLSALILSVAAFIVRGRIARTLPVIRAIGQHFGFATSQAAPKIAANTNPVLWSADMETGDLSQWSVPDLPGGPNAGGGIFNSGIATASVDDVAVTHSGLHSARLFILARENTDLATSGTRLFRWLEPETHPELYYSVWYYFPQRYTTTGNPAWWNVQQWKSKHAAGNDPFFALNVGNATDGSMYFYVYDQNSKKSYTQKIKNLLDGRWVHVEAFYKCAGDNSGHVSFWQDGVQIFDIPNVQTRYADGNCAWSVNNYSSGLQPSGASIYVDDAAICTGNRCP